ncbi:unnamed protein product [Agarophyton chilense]
MPRSKTTPPIRFPQPLPGGPRSRAASTTTRKARRHVVYNPPATAAFKRADRLPPCASGRTVACLYQLSLLEHESISITHHSLQRYLNFPADELASFRHQRIDAPVVLACHHEPYRMIGPSGKIISRTPPKAFREHSDSPCLPPNEPNDALFTVAVVKPASPQNQFNLYNIHTHAHSTPLALMSLILAQHVTLQYVSDIDALQIWYHPPSQPTLTENALASLSVRLARWLIHAHAGARIAPLETPSYTKQWVYQAIRRTKSDTDQHHFVPFLEQVRHTTALNVTLRPYQQRAVAWMLSRELRPPKSQRFVEWHLANQLSNNQFFREQAALNHLTTEAHAVFDVFEGAICLGPLNDPRNRSVPGAFGGLLCDEMGLGKTVELMQLVLCNTRDAAEIHIRKRCSPSRSRICPVCDGICRAASQSTEHPVCRCVDCGRTAHRDCVKGSNAAKKDYVCPACIDYLYSLSKDDIRETEMPKSKATLIIIPTALLIQWKTEIEKHVRDALNVVVFQGLRISGYIPQQVLQEADVVLTTYDALRADVNVVNSIRKPRNSRRFERKYFPLPVPLLGVHWHRVALDESQMLGAGSNSYSQVAEMASYIRATYKWCVTGTPMSTDLCDVVPMLRLLNLEDSTENTNWVSLLRTSPYEEDQNRVARILRSIMWRTRMYDVQLTELNIPRRNFEVVHTLLGPVEKYHYNTLQDHVHQLTSTRRADAASVNLLHMLRQACCHPRIGASGRRLVAVASSSKRPRENCVQEAERRAKSPLDLNEVLESILLKSQVECEEEFRNLVASMNGQAAISLLQFSVRPARNRNVDRLISAVQLYRDILHLAQCNEDIVRMDDIQVMHVKFNLNDALQTVSNFRQHLQKLKKPSSIDRDALNELKKVGESVQDGNLSKDVDALREKYIAEAQANLQLATATYNAKFSKLGETPLMLIDSMSGSGAEVLVNGHISKVIAIDVDDAEASVYVSDANLKASAGEVRQKQKSMKTQWWEIGLAVLVEEGKDTAFVDKMVQRLTDVLAGEVTKVNTIATRLHNLNALARVISEGLREIQEARLAFRNVLLQLPGAREPTEEDVSESGYCSNCRDHGRGPKCSHCRAENLITNVEKNVYSLRERKDDEFETNADQSQEKETSEGIDVEAVVKGTFHSRAANQGSPGPVETKADGDEDQIGKPSSFYNAEIEVMGQFGAKATALIRLLRSIWNRNDDEKVLIFSEWSEVLNLVRLSLERNNIPFCDGDQAKSSVAFAVIVDDFKSSNIRNVILLPLRKAGAGLNLTEASHVVLVEPSLQIALEAQAVGRVHRIGQTRETYVHRVIVRNTIEERILELGNKYRVDRNTSEEAVVDLNDVIQSIRSVQVSGHDSLPRSSQ